MRVVIVNLQLLIVACTSGLVVPPKGNGDQASVNETATKTGNAAVTSTTPHSDEKPEELCLRMHNNTAFMGVEPFARLRLYSASDCRKNCLEAYPKCVGVMFYYIHSGDKNKKHICYLFDKNSVNEEVALVPEKPSSPLDMVRSLEIVTNCHEFDPFPPLDVHFAMSTDKVPLKKRDVGFERPIRANGPWTPWSVCTLRTRSQVRSQPCEYGRHVQRRRCPHHVPVGTVSSGFVQPSSNYMLIAIPYPPTPYVHPSIQTEEYAQIMAVHQEQVQKSCCYRQQYVHQQLQQYPIGGAVQQVNYAMPAVPACPRPCAPFAGVGSPPWQQTGGTATVGQGALQHVHYQAASLLQYPPETTFVNQQQPHPHPQPHLQPQPYPQPQPQPQLQPQTQRYPQPQPQAQPYPQPEPQPLHPTLGHPIYEPGPQQVYYPSPQLEHLPSPQPSGEPLHHPQRPNGDKDVQPRLHETRPAPIQLRPPVWGEWSEWSACSGSCDIGTQQRYRKCETTHAGCEGEAVQQRPCEDIPFCETWAPWSEWSACRATCGSGERSRSRHCHLGKSHCDGLDFEVEACDAGTCPGWSAWEAWSDCTVTCGQGTRRRMRTCERGFCQGERYEEGACENAPCSHWADWQEWSYCSVSCGSGTKSRHRICIGNYCEGEPSQQEECVDDEQCPTWTAWQPWSQCSVTCGYGLQSRVRVCLGAHCPGHKVEEAQCELGPCAAWSNWQEWSQCSSSCGAGIQTRSRTCMYGRECADESEEIQQCTGTASCAQWTAWGSWSTCDKDCGPGKRTRRRDCISSEGYASESCQGDSSETSSCNSQPCCEWTVWNSWSGCDRDCGGGRITRTRMCLRLGVGQDASCHCSGYDREQKGCNKGSCPQPSQPDAEPKPPTIVQPVYQPIIVPGAVRPPSGPGASCQWSEWCGWTDYGYGVARRSRTCVGDYGCTCYGAAVEEANCSSRCEEEVPCEWPCRKK